MKKYGNLQTIFPGLEKVWKIEIKSGKVWEIEIKSGKMERSLEVFPFDNKNLKCLLACVAGVQRGGRGEVECEREARREREAPYERPTIALRARIQLLLSLPFVRRPRRAKCLSASRISFKV